MCSLHISFPVRLHKPDHFLSFNDTNADGIGDFDGIIEKLDYIKDMGFTAIWINPCFDSPFNDAGKCRFRADKLWISSCVHEIYE